METITIGGIEWSTANSSNIKMKNGGVIALAKSMEEWQSFCLNKQPCCCAYDFDEKNVAKYGHIYNAYVVAEGDNFSPDGFRIPSRNDWNNLLDALGGNISIDKNTPSPCLAKLKAVKGWLGKMNGTNESGFNALPGGDLFIGKEFRDKGFGVSWWTVEYNVPHITQYDKNKFKFHDTGAEIFNGPKGAMSGKYIRLIRFK
jgi:uncharacterized protein (TIGR02145 family)